jgi:hypothetical protein
MKNRIFITLGVLFLGLLWPLRTAAEDQVISSSWTNIPVKIDGAEDDWHGAEYAIWEKGEVQYSFRNDAENLYILFVFKNPKFRSTIDQTGINLYFNAEGKKKKDYSILFRKKTVPTEEAIAILEKETQLSEEQKSQLRAKPAWNVYQYEVVNKDAKVKQLPAGMQALTAFFKYGPQQQTFVYEFAIPLARVHEMAAGVGVEPGKTVTIGFEWGGQTEAMKKMASREASGTNIANEGIGTTTSDILGSARGRAAPPKYSFWAEVRLASQME